MEAAVDVAQAKAVAEMVDVEMAVADATTPKWKLNLVVAEAVAVVTNC